MKRLSLVLLITLAILVSPAAQAQTFNPVIPDGCQLSSSVFGGVDNPDVQSFGITPVLLYAYDIGRVYVQITDPIVQNVELFDWPNGPFYQNGPIALVWTDTPGSRFLICAGSAEPATRTPTPAPATPTPVPGCETWTGDTFTTTTNPSFSFYIVNFGSQSGAYQATGSLLTPPGYNNALTRDLPVGTTVEILSGVNVSVFFAIPGSPQEFGSSVNYPTPGSYTLPAVAGGFLPQANSLGGGTPFVIRVCVPTDPTATPAASPTPTSTNTPGPTLTPTPPAGCYQVGSDPLGIVTIPVSSFFVGQKTWQIINNPGGVGSAYVATVKGVTSTYYAGTYYDVTPGAYSIVVSAVGGDVPYAVQVCTTNAPTPTATVTLTPTSTGSPTATRTPTLTPTAGVAGCVGEEYIVPESPGFGTIRLEQNMQFAVADFSITIEYSTTLTVAPGGPYEWRLNAGNYRMSGIGGEARLLLCAVAAPPAFTPTIAFCECTPVTAIIPPTIVAGQLPDLSLPIPTLMPSPTFTMTGTVTISATVILAAIGTLEAGIATPAAALATVTTNYSYESGQLVSLDWSDQMDPALSWLSILNPDAAAWSSSGGPLWALAPLILPILPILAAGLLVAFFRVFLWFMAWFLKLIDLLFKLIELIPGQ